MHASGDRSSRAKFVIFLLTLALCLITLFSLTIGSSNISLTAVLWALIEGKPIGLKEQAILLDIRAPRTVMGLLVGASLAVSGAIMQGLFRNPLADPGLIGVSSGAGLGAVSAIVIGGLLPGAVLHSVGGFLVPIAAFIGGWGCMLILYKIATRQGRTSVAVMLLAGLALSAFAAALSGLLIYFSNDSQLRNLTFWNLGSIASAHWGSLIIAGPLMLISLLLAPLLASGLNRLALGESAAMHLGVSVQRLKRASFLLVGVSVGVAVAVSGAIGFIGIIVPHLLRLVIGPNHRYLLPAAALLGAITLLLADMLSRTLIAPAELPIGIVMAILGGPFFIYLLLRNRSLLDL
jgi:iron complex transport system permease protein